MAKIISNNDSIEYVYDLAQKISKYKYENTNLFTIDYVYNQNSNILNTKYQLNNEIFNVENIFNEDNDIVKTSFNYNDINYNYDKIGRLINKNINNNFNINYEYLSLGNRTPNVVKSIQNNDDKFSYRYDKLNNITHIYHNGILENKYIYDEYNELIEENNYINNQKIKYTYDTNGNLLSKNIYQLSNNNLISQNNYEYSNINWKDQLTKFNNNIITYDAIGNPLTIENNTLTWINGRQLSSISNSNNNISYKYNVSGIRIAKIVNNIETQYYTEGSHIIFEKTGNNVIQYIRNEVDNLIGIKYNNIMYYYIKNVQNDIIGILDSNNNVVCRYIYDSWGNILSITDSNDNIITDTNHIAYINPFRYRSYYYDSETNLYYLNSRYYNPVWGRFINADGIVGANKDILSYNLYAYCSNNPIVKVDYLGSLSLGGIWSGICKTVSSTVNKIKNTVSSIGKGILSVFDTLKKSFVFEFGHGPGLSGEVYIGALGVSTGNYKDYTRGIENGKYVEGTKFNMGTNGTVGPIKIGNELEIFHKKHEPTLGQNYIDHTWWFPRNSKIINCNYTEYNYFSGLSFAPNDNIESKKGSTFIGGALGFHIGYGFHIKAGFDFGPEEVN